KKRLVELTIDVTPDLRSIENADIIITTLEKWDGISRIPILEIFLSRMNYISSQNENKVHIVGLLTALANAQDLADWLCIDEGELFNFSHSVRPVPLDINIKGFSERHYCP
ncbi:5171_t:CDS:2, partial [Funneliformis geosporum]